MTNLSSHFTLEELVASPDAAAHGIDNSPTDEITTNLAGLCALALEPARLIWGVPVHIDSGYRCAALNAFEHGAHDSEHLFGHAADCIPQGIELIDAFRAIRASEIPFDQLIIENNKWIHIGLAVDGVAPRRECLVAQGTPGHWKYVPYSA
jgi:hypothetical protein